tara:strand:- start:3281 stop:4024 length:744 start_codon:yes stop_codon:yes gene_type:complete
MTNIAINGFFGKMGQAILLESHNLNSCIVTVGSDKEELVNKNSIDNIVLTTDISKCADNFDVVIDFSLPNSSLVVAKVCSDLNKPLVIGTTGFTEKELELISNYSKKTPILIAPNMSIGVNASFDAIATLSKLLPDYKVNISETHHKNKVDSPSGTALKFANVVCDARGESLGDITNENCPITFQSFRKDTEIGLHTITFKGSADQIVFTHTADNRNIFANGALRTAEWLAQQKPGYYNYQNYMESI